MAALTLTDWQLIESTFIKVGYVMDLSNDSFRAFFQTEIGVNIYSEAYSAKGNSKGSRLRAFLATEENALAGKALEALWRYKRSMISSEELGRNTIDQMEMLLRRLEGGDRPAPVSAPVAQDLQSEPVLQRPLHRETLKLLINSFRVDDDAEAADLSTSWVLEMFISTGVEPVAARYTGLSGFALMAAVLIDCNEVPGAIERFLMNYLEPRRFAAEPQVLRDILGELNSLLNADGVRLTLTGLRVGLELIDPVFAEHDGHEDAFQTRHNGSNDQDLPPAGLTPEQAIELLCHRFHQVVLQLRNRRALREPLLMDNEYDVQYLMHGLLRLFFDDVRNEETTPSYAGGSARMDYLIADCSFGFEIKMARSSLSSKSLGEQLIVDVVRYRQHPSCRKLFCFVYDPEYLLQNPRGLENDMTRELDGLATVVTIRP